MHILIIHQYYLDKEQGGGSRFNQFSRYWTGKGNMVTVISGMVHYTTGNKADKWKGKFIFEEKEDHVSVIRTYVSGQYSKGFLGRLWGYFSFAFSSSIAAFKLKNCPDIIIATSPSLFVGITGIIASLRFRRSLVFEVRDLWPESAIETGVLKNKTIIKMSYWLEKYIYKKAKAINVLTPAFKQALISKGVPSEKIWLIPNGADFDLFIKDKKSVDIRMKYGWTDKFVVLYMGAHGVANNLQQLIQAADQMQKELPQVLMVLIGDGMEKAGLINMVQEKGMQNVSFIPSQPKEKIKDFVYACDVGIAVLKKVEIFKTVYPNKVFDYMACSKPVILGIDGVVRDMVVNQAKCGIYCEPENAREIIEVIKTYLHSPDLRKQHGENGFNYVRNNFNRAVLAGNYLANLSKLVASGNNKLINQACDDNCEADI